MSAVQSPRFAASSTIALATTEPLNSNTGYAPEVINLITTLVKDDMTLLIVSHEEEFVNKINSYKFFLL